MADINVACGDTYIFDFMAEWLIMFFRCHYWLQITWNKESRIN